MEILVVLLKDLLVASDDDVGVDLFDKEDRLLGDEWQSEEVQILERFVLLAEDLQAIVVDFWTVNDFEVLKRGEILGNVE